MLPVRTKAVEARATLAEVSRIEGKCPHHFTIYAHCSAVDTAALFLKRCRAMAEVSDADFGFNGFTAPLTPRIWQPEQDWQIPFDSQSRHGRARHSRYSGHRHMS